MYVILKIAVSAIIIGIVTEVARKLPSYGGIIAALPLVSLLSIIWLHVQGEKTATLSRFALGVLWGFPATAIMLLIIYFALQRSLHLYISISLGILGWLVFLLVQQLVVKYIRFFFIH
ncbi:DUF3147 family protein [Gracilibacillus sp. S3-1-1]|uniref:DUF3147 family protein n=1 Tax=Gracilibacillus pellucidus TaxID=3095368 RepID=A0ACC6M3Q4_9BACI|nr:DUF3147 family protein [Gracilibacillus sp. S3-1-1]MDX8045591.1 DUF3147 family protein [Gracilibacillus sp. S3-1-1]